MADAKSYPAISYLLLMVDGRIGLAGHLVVPPALEVQNQEPVPVVNHSPNVVVKSVMECRWMSHHVMEIYLTLNFKDEIMLKIYTFIKDSCSVSIWSEWSLCSITCSNNNEQGQRTRSRGYINYSDPDNCNRTLTEVGNCTVDPCITTCNVSQWSQWSSCSKSCGTGQRTRSRKSFDPENPDCVRFMYGETEECYLEDCGMHFIEYSNITI
ncbi:hypothetical protein KUTeg_008788 [Tegillarca granosa]|uniref:Uncharacterized protein n=1 Tax=Tegillarca granosa TaxID=220873 RepID=A0ABQ9FA62_TEGGR|nr:hypothetical protein KUTeg_008788 [Tegillarca granosa]